jgi:hypothetical protein
MTAEKIQAGAQPICDHRRVERVKQANRGRRYQQFEWLELPESLVLPTCTTCSELVAESDTDAEAIDRAFADAYRERVAELAKEQLEKIVAAGVRKRDLERAFGVSPGYLSKVAGSKEPSSALVAALMLVSRSPRSRMTELAAAWNAKTVQPSEDRARASGSASIQSWGFLDVREGSNVIPLRFSSRLPSNSARE